MTAVLKRSENVVFRKIENEYILVPIKSNAAELDYIYVLNDVGARVWELIDGARMVGDIKDIICSEYDVTPETVAADLEDLFNELEALSTVASVA